MSKETFYDSIVNNEQMDKLVSDILADLKEKHIEDDAKIHTLLATIGYGFNNLFNTLPNLLITAKILETQLESATINDELKELCTKMISFIDDLTKSIENNKIIDITDELRKLTVKMNEAKNEGTTDSEVNEDGTEDLS